MSGDLAMPICRHVWGKWVPKFRDPEYKRERVCRKCRARELGREPIRGVVYRELVDE